MVGGLEHVTCISRLRDLHVLSTAKRRINLIAASDWRWLQTWQSQILPSSGSTMRHSQEQWSCITAWKVQNGFIYHLAILGKGYFRPFVLGDPYLCLAIYVIFPSARGRQRLQIKVSKFTRTTLITESPCSRTCGTSPPALLQMPSISWLAGRSQDFCLMTSWNTNLLLVNLITYTVVRDAKR